MQRTVIMKIVEKQKELSENTLFTEQEKMQIFYEYISENKDLFLQMEKALFKLAFLEGSIQKNFSDTGEEMSLAEHWYDCKFLKDEKRPE